MVTDVLPNVVPKKKKVVVVKHSVGFIRRVARMPKIDRKQIIIFLKKQERHKKIRKGKQHSKGTRTSNSDSSKSSTSSLNKDWENCLLLHGKPKAVMLRTLVRP